MRHQVKGKKLNRDSSHRKALYRNLITSLIQHGSIETSEAKAKAIKGQVDKLITKAKKGDLHNRRLIGKFLTKRDLVNTLVDNIAPKTSGRTSGYTRIIRLGQRKGDASMRVRLEFVDSMTTSKEVKAEKVSTKKTESKPKSKKAAPKKEAKKSSKKTTKTEKKQSADNQKKEASK
jgi:large subunit ribosomal protein L17